MPAAPDVFALSRSPRTVLFGPGQRGALAGVVAGLGRDVLVCTDARLGADARFAVMMESLRAAGCRTRVFDRTEPDLPVSSVEACMRDHGDAPVDVMLGVGGGSCMDLAKVVAVLRTHGGRVQDYYGEFAVPGPVLPVVAVPTTAGTGSEATPVAVLADPERSMKVGVSSPEIVPHTAVCDPELTATCPPALTASAGIDALAHCVESFTAISREADADLPAQRVFVGKNALADLYALRGVELLGTALPAAYEDGTDQAARQDVMLAALYGGYALGTGGTAAAHALQYPIGAETHTPHGVGVGTLLPYVMEFNRPARVPEFATLARAFGRTGADEKELSRQAVDAVADLVAAIGLPANLAALGLAADAVDRVGEQAMGAARLVQNNPRELDVPALQRITRAAFRGDRSALRD